jgi:hypothetical protein
MKAAENDMESGKGLVGNFSAVSGGFIGSGYGDAKITLVFVAFKTSIIDRIRKADRIWAEVNAGAFRNVKRELPGRGP